MFSKLSGGANRQPHPPPTQNPRTAPGLYSRLGFTWCSLINGTLLHHQVNTKFSHNVDNRLQD